MCERVEEIKAGLESAIERAPAAIKFLIEKVESLEKENKKLKERISELEHLLEHV